MGIRLHGHLPRTPVERGDDRARALATAAKDAYARAGKKGEAGKVAQWIDRTLPR